MDRIPRQFSVRDLLKLTTIVALVLTIGVLSRGSQYFGAFASPWTAASLLPIAAVWAVYRFQLATPRALALGSMLGYGVALGVPAMGWGDEIIFGWLAWWQSVVGLELFNDRHIAGGWFFGAITIPLSIPIACAIGAAANLAYLTAVAAYWIARNKPRALTLFHRAATFATILAVIALIPVCLTGDLTTLYPGYGLWTASSLALALASNRLDSGRQADTREPVRFARCN